MISGKCPAISRVVASGSPEARRKALDDQVERSPPEAQASIHQTKDPSRKI